MDVDQKLLASGRALGGDRGRVRRGTSQHEVSAHDVREVVASEGGGLTSYTGAFLGHWAHTLIFYDLPTQVFTVWYLACGALVIRLLLLVPPDFSSLEKRSAARTECR
jgi:hypothetical protein